MEKLRVKPSSIPISVYALSVGAFGIGTTEFVIMGLLLNISNDFNVSISIAAYTVTAYALGVVIGAPLITPFLTRYKKKPSLIALMLVFTAGNIYCALAASFEALIVARVITAFAHASFFGIGSVLAAELAPPDRKSSAVSAMFLGATLANILGVPVGTYIGQIWGWRTSFYLVSILGAISAITVLLFVPAATSMPPKANIRKEIRALFKPNVIKCFLITIFGFAGVFTAFTYIAPMLTQVTGFAEESISPILFLFGVGMIIGNKFGGMLSDKNTQKALLQTLIFLVCVLALFPLALHNKISAALFVFLLGAAMFSTIPPLQVQALESSADAPTLTSACNIAAFNFGNAFGAWIGGLVIIAGIGLDYIALFGAGLSFLGIVLLFIRTPLKTVDG